MVTDELGIEIKAGESVVMELGGKMIAGVVVSIREANLADRNGRPLPGELVLAFRPTFPLPPGAARISGLFVLRGLVAISSEAKPNA